MSIYYPGEAQDTLIVRVRPRPIVTIDLQPFWGGDFSKLKK
jgi:hypothetical protein